MRVLVDTNAYAAFKGGDPETVDVLRMADEIHLSVIVLGELLAGFAAGTQERRNRRELAAFMDSPRVICPLRDPGDIGLLCHDVRPAPTQRPTHPHERSVGRCHRHGERGGATHTR